MNTMKSTLSWFTSPRAAVIMLGLFTGIAHGGNLLLPFDAGNFTSPRDNLFLPMAIGATYMYQAEEEDGLVLNEITQTSATKMILGVPTTVVHDVEWIVVEGVGLVKTEETDDWIAWDNFGNVWYFGEDTTEFQYDDDWNPTGTTKEGSWEAGVDGAQPGILMLANPRPGNTYLQEFYEGVAEDTAKVLKLNETVSLELGTFQGCLKTKEWTPLDSGTVEHKYYAPGMGLVYIEELKGKTVKVELVEILH